MFVIKRSLRSAVFQIQKVPSSTTQVNIDIPFTSLLNDPDLHLANIPREKPTFVVCRFGNDSQIAVGMMKSLKEQFSDVRDIKGGLDAWAETFPTDIIPKY
jgi:rhodanese-related sulfurtransferase